MIIATSTRPADPGVIVVGGGPTGMHFAEHLCRIDSSSHVSVLCDEPWRPYDRVRLSAFVARELRHEALFSRPAAVGLENVDVTTGTRIVRIDRERRCVVDQRGKTYTYETLVLATGSRARVPPIPGIELSAVFVFRSFTDAQALLARQIKSRCTVVVGGGLLGLEAARAMLRFNTRVHVVEHERRLMFHQLDEEASGLLRGHVERLGIRVHTGDSVQQIAGSYTPSSVRLRSGEEIECDTVVIATGITPNVELARDAGIAVGRGIRVNDRMQTSDASVYAVGECAEHRGIVYGLVGPGIEQAAVAASSVAGRDARYAGSVLASSLKVVGCPVFSMGDTVDSNKSFKAYMYRDGDCYRRINVHRGRVVGAVGVGAWDVARLRTMGLERRRLWPWQLRWFRANGRLWVDSASSRVAAWPADALVCTCRGVSRARLGEAIEGGAASVEALAACTGASTVCGSCAPLLAELVSPESAAAPARVPKGLLAVSSVAAASAASTYVLSLPYSQSAASAWHLDVLWTDALYKQVSGFSLLGLGLLLSVLTLRKRLPRFTWLSYAGWQHAHVVAGLAVVLVLAVHTGFRFGANLNAWLMVTFTGLLVAGGIAGAATALAQRLAPAQSRRARAAALWLHVLFLWPLPVLLGFHVFKGYYF